MKNCIKIFLLLFAAIFRQNSADSQTIELDSLFKVLRNHPAEDTARAGILIAISISFADVDPGKGFEFAENAIRIAKKKADRFLIAESYNAKANNLIRLGEYSKALDYLTTALDIYKNTDKKKAAFIFRNMASAYFQKANFTEAIRYDLKSDSLLALVGDKKHQALGYINTGTDYLIISDFVSALDYFHKGLAIAEQINYLPAMCNAYGNMVEVYNGRNEFDKALENAQKALQLSRRSGNDYLTVAMLGQIGQIYRFKNNLPEALRNYQAALASPNLDKYINVKANIYHGLGTTYIQMGNYRVGLANLNEAKEIFTKLEDLVNLSTILSDIGKLYYQTPIESLKRQNIQTADRLSIAMQYQRMALGYAEKIHSPQRQVPIWEDISRIYEMEYKFKEALDAYRQSTIFKDSIISDSNNIKIATLQLQYENDKKTSILKTENANERKLEKARARQQETVIAAISATIIILLAAGLFFIKAKSKQKEAEMHAEIALANQKEAEMHAEISKVKQQEAELEMKALRAQLNPHFIFNSLGFLQNAISKGRISFVSEYISKFSELMRTVVNTTYEKEILLSKELHNLSLYMEVENLSLDKKFLFEVRMDGTVDPENTLFPPWLLQPLLENAIKYSRPGEDSASRIILTIELNEDMLECKIKNNGKILGTTGTSRTKS